MRGAAKYGNPTQDPTYGQRAGNFLNKTWHGMSHYASKGSKTAFDNKLTHSAWKFYLQHSNSIAFIVFLGSAALVTKRFFHWTEMFQYNITSETKNAKLWHILTYWKATNISLKPLKGKSIKTATRSLYLYTNLAGLGFASAAAFNISKTWHPSPKTKAIFMTAAIGLLFTSEIIKGSKSAYNAVISRLIKKIRRKDYDEVMDELKNNNKKNKKDTEDDFKYLDKRIEEVAEMLVQAILEAEEVTQDESGLSAKTSSSSSSSKSTTDQESFLGLPTGNLLTRAKFLNKNPIIKEYFDKFDADMRILQTNSEEDNSPLLTIQVRERTNSSESSSSSKQEAKYTLNYAKEWAKKVNQRANDGLKSTREMG